MQFKVEGADERGTFSVNNAINKGKGFSAGWSLPDVTLLSSPPPRGGGGVFLLILFGGAAGPLLHLFFFFTFRFSAEFSARAT